MCYISYIHIYIFRSFFTFIGAYIWADLLFILINIEVSIN